MDSTQVVVEYAKSGRAACKDAKCKKIVEKGCVRRASRAKTSRHRTHAVSAPQCRIGKQTKSAFSDDAMMTTWHHVPCFFLSVLVRAKKLKVDSVADMDGFAALEQADKDEILGYVKGTRKQPSAGNHKCYVTKAGNDDDDDDDDDAKPAAAAAATTTTTTTTTTTAKTSPAADKGKDERRRKKKSTSKKEMRKRSRKKVNYYDSGDSSFGSDATRSDESGSFESSFVVSDDDDDDDDDTDSDMSVTDSSGTIRRRKWAKTGGKEPCMYGAKCYRKNPDHIKRFWHPSKDGEEAPGADEESSDASEKARKKKAREVKRREKEEAKEKAKAERKRKREESDAGKKKKDDEAKKKDDDAPKTKRSLPPGVTPKPATVANKKAKVEAKKGDSDTDMDVDAAAERSTTPVVAPDALTRDATLIMNELPDAPGESAAIGDGPVAVAVEPKKATVALVDLASSARVELGDGETALGRGPLLKVTNTKCSRKQVMAAVELATGKVVVTPKGANPAQMLRKGKETDEDLVTLEKDRPVELHDGDVIFLLAVRQHGFRVAIDRPLGVAARVATSGSAAVRQASGIEPAAAAPPPAALPTEPSTSTGETPPPSIALPVLAVGPDHKFDAAKAAKVAAEQITAFLTTFADRADLSLVLVIDDEAAQQAFNEHGADLKRDRRFHVLGGTMLTLKSDGVPVGTIVNDAHWRFKPVGHVPHSDASDGFFLQTADDGHHVKRITHGPESSGVEGRRSRVEGNLGGRSFC